VLRPVGCEALAGLISSPDPLEVGGVRHHSQVLDILVSHVLGFQDWLDAKLLTTADT